MLTVTFRIFYLKVNQSGNVSFTWANEREHLQIEQRNTKRKFFPRGHRKVKFTGHPPRLYKHHAFRCYSETSAIQTYTSGQTIELNVQEIINFHTSTPKYLQTVWFIEIDPTYQMASEYASDAVVTYFLSNLS